MKFTMKTVITPRQAGEAVELLKRNNYVIPEGLFDVAKRTGPGSLNFYAMAQNDKGTLFLSKIGPYDTRSEPAVGPVKIETDYMESDMYLMPESRGQFLRATLRVCADRMLPVVLTYKEMLRLAGKQRKRVAVMTTQSEADEARAFLERNHFEIPQGMADDVRQTGPASQAFYVMDRNADGGILCVAKLGPLDVRSEPDGPVKIEAVYMDETRKGLAPKRQFLEDILRVCANRTVSGVLLRIEDMGLLSV